MFVLQLQLAARQQAQFSLGNRLFGGIGLRQGVLHLGNHTRVVTAERQCLDEQQVVFGLVAAQLQAVRRPAGNPGIVLGTDAGGDQGLLELHAVCHGQVAALQQRLQGCYRQREVLQLHRGSGRHAVQVQALGGVQFRAAQGLQLRQRILGLVVLHGLLCRLQGPGRFLADAGLCMALHAERYQQAQQAGAQGFQSIHGSLVEKNPRHR